MHRRTFLKSGASAALFACAPGWMVAAPPAVVVGRVVKGASESGLAGVLVSNGDDVVWTDEAGEFRLPWQSARHAFVLVEPPPGWIAAGASHQTAKHGGAVRFSLMPAPALAEGRLRILHLTDSHIGVPETPHYVSPAEWREDLEQAVRREKPDVVIVTGDLTDLGRAEDLQAYAAVVGSVGVPVFSLFAGHDGLAEMRARSSPEVAVTRHFEASLGPVQQSFHLGGHYFMVYPEPYGFPDWQKRQLDRWRSRLLDAVEPAVPIVWVAHDPTTWHPDKKAEVYGPSLRDFPSGRKPRLILNGQYHGARTFTHDGTTIVGAPSCSMGPIDGSPRSYAVIDLRPASLDVAVRPFRRTLPADGRRAATVPRWRRELGHTVHRTSPVVVGSLALVTVADFQGAPPGVTAVDVETGEIRWRLVTPEVIKHSVVPAADGRSAYATTIAGTALCFDLQTGKIIWHLTLPNHPDRWLYQRPVLHGSNLIIPQASARLALDIEKRAIAWSRGQQWENAWHLFGQEPSVIDDRLYLLTPHSFKGFGIECVEAGTGRIVWRAEPEPQREGADRIYQLIYASPVMANGWVAAPGFGGRVVALSAQDGKERWSRTLFATGAVPARRVSTYNTIAEYVSSLTLAGDVLIVTSSLDEIVAVSLADGSERWRRKLTGASRLDCVPYFRDVGNQLAPPMVHGDQVIVGGTDGALRSLSLNDGSDVAIHDLGSALTGRPTLVGEDVLVATFDGALVRVPRARGSRA